VEELTRTEQVDQRYFWYLVNKARKPHSNKRMQPTRNAGGDMLYEQGEIVSSWREYYADLHTPKSEPWYNDGHHAHVLHTLSSLPDTYLLNDDSIRVFSEGDVQRKCSRLKCRKAAGVDGITGENLRYGGKELYRALAILFNSIISLKVVPIQLKRAVIVPIPKGKNTDLSNKDNFRGISLLPVISKVLEQLLCEWFDDDLGDFNHLQGAAQSDCSSLHSTMLLREVIQYHVQMKSTVYVTLCDARKAYDTVNYDSLFFKLYQMNCNNILWRVLKNLYTDFHSCVFIAGQQSSWFKVQLGVHQGAPLSMKLYMVFNNDLLEDLCAMGVGAGISRVFTPLICPAFADDLAIITLYKPLMHVALKLVYAHSARWRYSFNPDKSHVLVFGEDHCRSHQLALGEAVIATVKCDKHLGVPLATTTVALDDAIRDRISSGRSRFYCTLSIGSGCNRLPPNILSKLYWSVVIPHVTYGLEIVSLSHKSKTRLESAHANMAKIIQHLPSQAANVVSLAALGWWSIDTYLSYRRLILMWHILLLPMSSIYKVVLINTFCMLHNREYGNYITYDSPVGLMYRTCVSCGIDKFVYQSITSGVYISMEVWKVRTKSLMWRIEKKIFMNACITHISVSRFSKCTELGQIWPWWSFCKYNPLYHKDTALILRLLTCNNIIDERLRLPGASRFCQDCCKMTEDNVHHMLFECDQMVSFNYVLWQDVMNEAPEALAKELGAMIAKDRSQFILSGMRGYLCEWNATYVNICRFITDTYHYKCSVNVCT